VLIYYIHSEYYNQLQIFDRTLLGTLPSHDPDKPGYLSKADNLRGTDYCSPLPTFTKLLQTKSLLLSLGNNDA
jgi:hypothetical protein